MSNSKDTATSTELVSIPVPLTDRVIMATLIDDKPWVALKPMCEAIGIDAKSQRDKLQSKSWARGVLSTSRDSAGREQEMFMIDRRTMTMWLGGLDENRVGEQARPIVIAFQAEAADALDAYFHQGGAINPRATEHQLNALIFQSRAQIELCQAAKGLIHPDHLEAKARVILARGLGEHAELDPMRKPLYTHDFLESKNLSAKRLKSVAGVFGKRVKKAYIDTRGIEPQKYPLDLSNGQTKDVLAYTEADRPLMDGVWAEFYAPLTLDGTDA